MSSRQGKWKPNRQFCSNLGRFQPVPAPLSQNVRFRDETGTSAKAPQSRYIRTSQNSSPKSTSQLKPPRLSFETTLSVQNSRNGPSWPYRPSSDHGTRATAPRSLRFKFALPKECPRNRLELLLNNCERESLRLYSCCLGVERFGEPTQLLLPDTPSFPDRVSGA